MSDLQPTPESVAALVTQFETELSALSPRGISPDIRRRVAARLAPTPTYRWVGRIAVAGALTAAAGILFLVAWQKDIASPEIPVIVPDPATTIEAQTTAPALVAYQRALARSPEELDALLDRSAAATSNAEPAGILIGTYPRSRATFNALLGDS